MPVTDKLCVPLTTSVFGGYPGDIVCLFLGVCVCVWVVVCECVSECVCQQVNVYVVVCVCE